MKKLIYLLLVVLLLPMTACEEKDTIEHDLKTPATLSDIQGKWINWNNSYKTTFEFKGNAYSAEVKNPFNENLILFETGVFVMEGNKMTISSVDGESAYDTLEAYCQDKEHNIIFFSPVGVFTKEQ